jgi:RNA recognition motif-containing protein
MSVVDPTDASADQEDELRRRRTVFVGNLSYETTDDSLRAHFETKGTLVSARVATNDQGRSKGFGFVEYTTEDAAERARLDFNQTVFNGRSIQVNPSNRRSRGRGPRGRYQRGRSHSGDGDRGRDKDPE